MIVGLHIEVSAEQLGERIAARVAHHLKQVELGRAQLPSLPEPEDDPSQTGFASRLLRARSPREMMKQRIAEHIRKATLLTFIREHLIPGEIYRLRDADLEVADLLPSRPLRWQ